MLPLVQKELSLAEVDAAVLAGAAVVCIVHVRAAFCNRARMRPGEGPCPGGALGLPEVGFWAATGSV